MTTPSDPVALLRSRSYVALLVLAAIVGVPISAASYFFLALVSKLQVWVFTDLPKAVGFHSEPLWWPLLPLLPTGVLLGLLCGHRRYADRPSAAAGGRRRQAWTFGIITGRRGTPARRRPAGSGRAQRPGVRSGRSPVL